VCTQLILAAALSFIAMPLAAEEWKLFNQDDGRTAGVESGNHFFGFVCRPEGIGVQYLVPTRELHRDVRGLIDVDINMGIDGGRATHAGAAANKYGSRTGFLFIGPVADMWVDKALKAKTSVTVGVANDMIVTDNGLLIRNATTFDAAGASDAIRALKRNCH
jgi:hypothetical protein